MTKWNFGLPMYVVQESVHVCTQMFACGT